MIISKESGQADRGTTVLTRLWKYTYLSEAYAKGHCTPNNTTSGDHRTKDRTKTQSNDTEYQI